MAKKAETQKPEKGMLATFFEDLGNKSPSTIAGYKTAIWQFIKFIYKDAEKSKCDQYVEKYFKESRNYHTDFKGFVKTLNERPGLSAQQVFNQIKKFFELCDVTFSKKEIEQIKNQLPGGGVLTQESDLDTDTIRAILQHCDVKGKAIILCLASGGMRIGELLQVRCADVDLQSVPAVIQIRAKTEHGKTKTRKQRYTFISSEAVAAVKEWIKIRPTYLQDAAKKGQNFKSKKLTVSVSDERLFPLSDNSVNELFKDAIVAVFGKNELDPNTNRSTRHIHQLRKFFHSQLSLVTSESVADFLEGHKTALSDNYRRYPAKQMAQYYLKGEHMLYIEAPAELREAASTTKKEISEIKDNHIKNSNLLTSYIAENLQLQNKLKEQQKRMEAQQDQMGELQNQFSELQSVLMEVISQTGTKVKINDLPPVTIVK